MIFFPKFPLELRRHIWRYACMSRRTLEVVVRGDLVAEVEEDLPNNEMELAFRPEDSVAPALLHVNSEARSVGTEIYLKLSFVSHPIYFNPEMDIIYFGDETSDYLDIRRLANKSFVRYLACRTERWVKNTNFHPLEVFRQFHFLEEITFVHDGRYLLKEKVEQIKKAFRRERRTHSLYGVLKLPKLNFAAEIKDIELDQIELIYEKNDNYDGDGDENSSGDGEDEDSSGDGEDEDSSVDGEDENGNENGDA